MKLSDLKRALAPLRRKIMNVIARGVIKVVSEKGLQRLQMTATAEETLDDLQVLGHYGLATSPPVGSEGVIIFPGGDRSAGLVIATENRSVRMKVANGEVSIYDNQGQFVHIKQGGVIEVKANTKVLANTPLFETTADAKIGGNLEVVGNTLLMGTLQVNLTSLLTGLVTAPGGVISAGVISAATIAQTAGVPTPDMGARIDAIRIAHNTHKHPETGTTTGLPDTVVP